MKPHQKPIIHEPHFLQATRFTGYRSTAHAIAELIDNSIEARATRVEVTITRCRSQFTIEVLDNGSGMSAEVLWASLQFGGSSRYGSRTGLGRFGFGLPNSSLSQARRVDVWSSDGTCPHHAYIDLDELLAGKLSGIAEPEPSQGPTTGTLVKWSNCDLIDKADVSSLEKELTSYLGRVFRRFLPRVQIRINNKLLPSVDPLFLDCSMPFDGVARQYGEPLVYPVRLQRGRTADIRARFSELPIDSWRTVSNAQKRALGIVGGAGVSVLRAGREISYGWHFFGAKRRENYDDWWRCEVEFSPELDELFGITHTKQQVTASEQLLKIIGDDFEHIARKLNVRVREAFRRNDLPLPNSAAKQASHVEDTNPAIAFMGQPTVGKPVAYRITTQDTGRRFLFEIETTKTGKMTLILNEGHPFYAAVYRPLQEAGARHQKGIELFLLAIARSEVENRNIKTREMLERHRAKWSDTLSLFLGY